MIFETATRTGTPYDAGRPAVAPPVAALALAVLALAMLTLAGRAAAQVLPHVDAGAPQDFGDRPNILLVIADDLGVDRVGAYGEHPDPGHTPVIDGIAAAGVLFRNAWSNPTCSPTRATILTGRYGFRTGIGRSIAYTAADFELAVDEPGLPRVLRGGFHGFAASDAWSALAGGALRPRVASYRTAAVGKWHLAMDPGSGLAHPLLLGFDHHLGPIDNIPETGEPQTYFDFEKAVDGVATWSTTYATTDQVDDALAFIGATAEPWLVWLAFSAPHGPFHAPPPSLHSFDLPPAVWDDVPLHHKAMTEAMDSEIGRLLGGIAPDVLARTYVVFVGDNGTPSDATTSPFPAGHAKATPYEGALNVPLVIAGPGVTAGAECAGLVNTTDLFATICELAGVHPGPTPDSVSLAPYLTQPDGPSLRSWVYAESFAPNGPPPYATHTRIVREARYKLIHRSPVGGGTITLLFDLLLDPFERSDLLSRGPLGAQEQSAYDFLMGVLAGLS